MNINGKLYFTILSNDVSEGGMARNNAFFSFIESEDFKIINVFSKFYFLRFLYFLRILFISFMVKKKIIFIHFGVLTYLFPPRISMNYMRTFFKMIINRLDKNNFLIIEVNDLPYEQSIDLELPIYDENKLFQKDVFNLKFAEFIFASNCMKNFVIEKYFSYDNKCYVIRNGSPKLKPQKESEILNFITNLEGIKVVYAGTLNKGRQIEELITLFEDISIHLILIGTGGEWISKMSTKKNIWNLGNYQEQIAHQIVAKCDLSLLPYDSSRLYYNLCYPTKVPFYFTALTPILSTPLQEVMDYCNNGIIYCDFIDWVEIFSTLKIQDIRKLKSDIDFNKYTWSEIFSNFSKEKPW